MDTPTTEATPTRENDTPRKNIPVICTSGRPVEGNNKPHGIHLNPKFFKQGPSPELGHRQAFGRFIHGPPQQPRFDHDLRMRFNGNPPYNNFDLHHRRYIDPGFRPNHHGFQGPVRYPPPFTQNRFPPPNHFPFSNNFDWQNTGDGVFPLGPTGAPSPSFPNDFPSHYYGDNNWNRMPLPPQHPECHYQEFQQRQPLSDFRVTDPQAVPHSAFHREFCDNNDLQATKDAKGREFYEEQKEKHEPRSRSRNLTLQRHGRSLSRSPLPRHSDSRHERRSRSLSSSPSLNKKRQSSESESGSDEETIWDSTNEGNSDSDLDLSKPLDSLTTSVANSKSLLKSALKCLGPSKVQTMIPVELCQMNKKDLFRMCKELLDETENDQLIKVMEGKVNLQENQESPTESSHNRKSRQMSTDSDEINDVVQHKAKVNKKKKSKKKRKKRKKNHRETESEESQSDLDSDNSGESRISASSSSSSTPTDPSVPKGGLPTTKAQQSLLELIQIEYKTKAINAMLKNLGVATEISSLVSNALQNNNINIVSNASVEGSLLNQNQNDNVLSSATKEVNDSSKSIIDDNQDDIRLPTTTTNEIVINQAARTSQLDEDLMESETNKATSRITLEKNEKLNSGTVNVEEEEVLKLADDDVLDLEVDTNDEIYFL